MIINHHYQILYKEVKHHTYEEYEPRIGTIEYKDRIEPYLHTIWDKLNENSKTRQAVITLNRLDFMSCLLSFGVQLNNNELYVTINMRSQAKEYIKKDINMYLYWVTQIIKNLEYLLTKVYIDCFVANFHSRKELTS